MNEPQSETPETDQNTFTATPESEDLLETMDVVSADFARTLERQRDAALTDRSRFEQGVENLKAQLDALRAERDEIREQLKISNDPDYSVLVYQELDVLRSEVERLTKERDDSLQRLENERQRNIAFCNKFADLKAELATLRAAREQDDGAAIEAAAKECADEMDDLGNKWIIAIHMRALVATVTTVTNPQQKGGDEPCPAPAPTTMTPAIPIAQSIGTSNAAPTSEPEGTATCRRCGGALKRGTAIPTAVVTSDEGTISYARWDGVSPRISVWKCAECGHSFAGTPAPSPTVMEAAKEIVKICGMLWTFPPVAQVESILTRLLGNTEAERRKLMEERDEAQLSAEIKVPAHELAVDMMWHHKSERDSLRSQLESSQAECAAVRVCFAEASHNAGPAFVAHERLASLEAECERLRKLLGELRDVTQSLVKLAEVWTPEFTQTIHNARCVISDAAMQPASAPVREAVAAPQPQIDSESPSA